MNQTQERDRLNTIRQKKAEKRDELKEARDQLRTATERLAESPTVENGREIARFKNRVEDLRSEIEALGTQEQSVLRQFDGRSSFGTMGFLADPEVVGTLERFAGSSVPIGRVNLGELLSRNETVQMTGRMMAATPGQVTPTEKMQTGPFAGIVPQLEYALSFLDLMPTIPMDAPIIPYVRVVPGSGEGAGTVAPGAVKPQASFDYEDDEARSHVIAEWVKALKQNLADIGGLEATIRNRLLYNVLQKLESLVIAGDGVGENLLGILNTTGIGDVPYVAGHAADLVLEGVVDVLVSGARPNMTALHPKDWASLISAKDDNNAYVGAGPFAAAAQALWNTVPVPVVGMPQGTALVGDTRLGARLHVREGVHVIISDSDADDFTRNRATLLAEGRWALTVDQPNAWAQVHVVPPAP